MINLNDTPPKKTSPCFVHNVNTLGVETENGWVYYPIKVDREPEGNYLLIQQAPPVLADGILALSRKRYFKVTMQDIVRRRIDVSQQCERPGRASTGVGDSASAQNEPRIGGSDWAKECEDANLAFEQQVAALYGSSNSEEEIWQVPDNS